jgi:hypothetical protein
MFGQIFANSTLGERTGRRRPSTGSGRHNIWAIINLSRLLGRKPNRLFATTPSASPRQVLVGRIGIFSYLAGVALVGIITIGVFFGVGIYWLAHPTERVTAALSALHDEGATAVLATTDKSSPPAVAGDPPKRASTIPRLGAEPSVTDSAEPPGGRRSEPNRIARASSETVSGAVSEAPDAMTWVVADRAVQLWGVRPGPPSSASLLRRFVESVRAQGPVACQKHEHSSRYRCSTAAGEDIAEAILLGGVGRAAERATRSYRDAEAQARQKGKGLWAKL